MPRLVLSLDDHEVSLMGLMGDWSRYPGWLSGALSRCVAEAPLALAQTCDAAGLIGVLESALRRLSLWDQLPSPVLSMIRVKNLATEIVSRVLWSEGVALDYVCGELGIEPIFLKGYSSSLLHYNEVYERFFHDIDLLVPEHHAVPAYLILQKLGYVAGDFDPTTRRIVAHDQGIPPLTQDHYELPRLWKLVSVDPGEGVIQALSGYCGSNLFVEGERIWVPVEIEVHYALTADRRIPWKAQVVETGTIPKLRCLDWETQLITATTKSYTDLVVFKMKSLKLISDALRIINRSGGQLDWSGIHHRARSYGVSAPFRYVLEMASRVFGLSDTTRGLQVCQDNADQKPLFDFGDIILFLFDGPKSVDVQLGSRSASSAI